MIKLNERELKHLRVALLICLIVFAVFFGLTAKLINDALVKKANYDLYNPSTIQSEWNVLDTKEHFLMAQGNGNSAGNSYPPLFSWVSNLWSFDAKTFYIFSLLIISLIIPLVLFFLVKPLHYITVVAYFASAFPFIVDVVGFFPMALIGLLMVSIIAVKNWFFRIAALFLALLIHSYGFPLILLVLILLAVFEKPFLFKGFLGCVPGTIIPATIKQKIGLFDISLFSFKFHLGGLNYGGFASGRLLDFFFRILPLPVFLVGFFEWFKTRQWFFIVLFVVLFFASGFYSRILYLLPLLLVFGVAPWFVRQPKRVKVLFCLILLGFVFLQFYSWVGLKQMNYGIFEGEC